MQKGKESLHFYYDAQGKPAVVEWNGASYAYVYNMQGDVVALVDKEGKKVVKYTYDAWGKPINKTGSLARILGILNPFRYRGYVFDEETGLYYLRSRYYTPNWCRFINADNVFAGSLFCYCTNNPIVKYDENGRVAKYAISKEIGMSDYTAIIDKRLKEVMSDFKKHSVGNYQTPNMARSLAHWRDYQWFAQQVTHNGPWDIKRDEPWRLQFPATSMPTWKEQFLYRGEKVTREALGNITYGYLGTAMGCGPEMLFAGGGIAKQIPDFSTATLEDWYQAVDAVLGDRQTFGDDKNDHIYVTKGIEYYWNDYH